MNKKNLLPFFFALLLQLTISPVYGVKAYPFPITVTQPDGSQLSIRLKGDEFHHYQTTEDGYLLKKNTNGYLTYATLNAAGQTVESSLIAKDVKKRTAIEIQFLKTAPTSEKISTVKSQMLKSNKAKALEKPQRQFPLTGTPKSLVILVNFSDKSYVTTSPKPSFTDLLNQDGYSTNGGTGSARDYFMACSYGKFAPTFDVVGPYTLTKTMATYGANDASDNDVDPQQLVIDACTAANTAGLDFTQYDTDNDGFVDNVFVYYAGFNEAEGGPANTIWPHRWSLADYNTKFDGKTVFDYACTSELKGTSGSSMCGIGTFSHEFGHTLGLPDHYHTAENKTSLETWDIMDGGAYNNGGRTPPTYSVYQRFFLNYITPQQVSTPSDLTLLPIYQGKTQPANTINQSFLFSATNHNLVGANPTPKEFFMVEYRKKTGWDAFLPAEGMLIWHIDFDQTAWNDNGPNNYTGTSQTASSHMRVYLQPLTGSSTTPGTAFTTGNFTPTTWAGSNINRAITSITKTTDNITFKVMGGTPNPTISSIGTTSAFTSEVNIPSEIQSITVSGAALTNNMVITLLDKTNFDIRLSTDASWAKTVTIIPNSGNISSSIQIRYNPTTVGTHTEQLGITSIGATAVNLNLSGTSTAPYDPTAPVIIVGKIENLLQFPERKVNTTVTKTLNIKTTNIVNNLSLVITGDNANQFSVSANSLIKDNANSNSGINITVSFSPTTLGQQSATLTISGGGLNPDRVIILSGIGI